MNLQKRNRVRTGNGFLFATALSALFLVSCSDSKLPAPPKAHPELLLEVYDATAKGNHKLALVKIERLRAIEKTSVFLSELEAVERNNAVMEHANGLIKKGKFTPALNYLEAQEVKNGKHEDTTEAMEQLKRLVKIASYLEQARKAKSSDQLEKALAGLRSAAKNIMISQKIQNFIERKESEVKTMQMAEKDRMQFGMIADIGMLLEQEQGAAAAAVTALLALENGTNPALPKILSAMAGSPGGRK